MYLSNNISISESGSLKVKVFILVIFLFVPIGILILSLARREPQYQGKSAAVWFQEMKPLEQSPGLDALNIIGGKAVPVLQEELRDSLPNNRYKAAWALGQMGTVANKAVPSLIHSLQDVNNSVRYYAIQSLTIMNVTNEELIPALMLSLSDPNKSVSAGAAELLNKIEQTRRDNKMSPPFTNEIEYSMAFLNSSSQEVRLMGIERLGHLSDQKNIVMPILKSLSNDTNKTIRANAAMFLKDFEELHTSN
jgi:HEAT repeat protein